MYAWIYVPGTNVDYPVLQHPTDDAYYLEHNMDGSKGLPGCIYSESVNTKDFYGSEHCFIRSQHENGSMFASLHILKTSRCLRKPLLLYLYGR